MFMKNWLYIIVLVFLICGCGLGTDKKSKLAIATTEITSNDYLDNFNKANFKIIEIDSLKNFSALLNEMKKLSCSKKIIGLNFKDNDTVFKLTGLANCPTNDQINCYFRRNVLIVKNDSLKNISGDLSKLVHIKNLDSEILKIKAKDHNYYYNTDTLKPALIHLHIQDNYPIAKTKEVLKQIVTRFKKDTTLFNYNILFEDFSHLDIPAPPPPTELKGVHIN